MAEVIFETDNIVKKYKRSGKTFSALNQVNMEIRRGDIYGFVGQNGAGKTTMIRINGIIEAPAFYPGMTARDNLEVCRLQRGISDKKCIDRVLETVGLDEEDIDGVKAKNFSLGMKQRLGIAIALLGDPEFLFFDEPLNGLDPVGIRDFRKLMQRLNRESGITILISSHMLKELDRLATCYGFIHRGKMLEQISTDELRKKFSRYIHMKVDSAAGAEKILKEKFGVRALKVTSEDTIDLYEQLNKAGEIMKALINGGVTIEEMTLKGQSLEKYYLSLIKK